MEEKEEVTIREVREVCKWQKSTLVAIDCIAEVGGQVS